MKTSYRKSLAFALGAVAIAAASLLMQGCSSSAAGAGISIPKLVPLVTRALPAGLKTGGSRSFRTGHDSGSQRTYTPSAVNALGATYITNTFQNYFNPGDGSNVKGYLLSQVTQVDDRSDLFNGAAISGHSCLSKAASPYTIDLSALNTTDTTSNNMLKFTLGQLQCSAVFNGSTGASGEVFGTSGTNTSIWVTLTDMAQDTLAVGGAFLTFANVSNLGSTSAATPESVDGLSLNYTPATTSLPARMYVARYKATTTTNSFELYFASTEGTVGGFSVSGANGAPNQLGAGFRMISDGVNIYADGRLCNDSSGASCGTDANWQSFSVCMDATSLAVVDPDSSVTPNCLVLANGFTLSPNATAFTNTTLTGFTTSSTSPDPLTFSSFVGGATTWGDLGTNSPSHGITAEVLDAMTSVYPISNASSVTSTY